jgi:hypothetical protein
LSGLPLHREGKAQIGLLDTGRGALFSKADEHVLRKLVTKPHFDSFNDLLDRKLNDQTAFCELTNKPLDPIMIAGRKDDITTTTGLQHMAKLGVGESATVWGYGACGTGTADESQADTQLGTELARIALSTGDRFRSGVSMKFGMYFDSDTPSGTITEWAPGNSATPGAGNGDILCRTKQTPGLPHITDQTFFMLTQVVILSMVVI